MQRLGRWALLGVLALGAAGCGGGGEKSAPPPAETGYVDPGTPPADGKMAPEAAPKK